ncbi:MAG: FAD-binding protein [Candidatus Eiseniibacteriota bacterium]|nr:MAG: FAD-binding protein [Candidatus Eisenbacteria bacterium]
MRRKELSPSAVRAFQEIMGQAGVFTSLEDRICYSFDATTYSSVPGVVLRPSSAEQVSRILAVSSQEGLPVVPRGAGTGFAGSAIPLEGSVALSFERMNRILDFSPDDRHCVVEPGVVNGLLQKHVGKKGLFFPPDPSSLDVSTLGGNVAQSASGPRALRYGSTKDYVTSLDLVAGDGQLWHVSEKSGGYDLLSLLVGSEGTLGILTAIGLRLVPVPSSWNTFMAYFRSLEQASVAVAELSSQGIIPTVLEAMDHVTLRCVEEFLGRQPSSGVGAVLFVEVTGSETEVKVLSEKLELTFSKLEQIRFESAVSEAERERLWTLRRSVSPALARVAPTKINEDVCVPRSKLPALVRAIEALAERHGLDIYTFGHIGDGNLHVNIMTDVRKKKEMERVEQCADELFEATWLLGGTITGEHGIGIAKRKYLPREVGRVGMRMFGEVKRAFDEANILNPGKVVPSEPAHGAGGAV